jgi:hypothetical protein
MERQIVEARLEQAKLFGNEAEIRKNQVRMPGPVFWPQPARRKRRSRVQEELARLAQKQAAIMRTRQSHTASVTLVNERSRQANRANLTDTRATAEDKQVNAVVENGACPPCASGVGKRAIRKEWKDWRGGLMQSARVRARAPTVMDRSFPEENDPAKAGIHGIAPLPAMVVLPV